MRFAIFGIVPAALAAGCAGPLDHRDFDRDHGVNARWLEDVYAREINRGVDAPKNDAIFMREAQDGIDAESTLDDLIAYALEHHPSVQAVYAAWSAARERIIQARRLPDPQLTYGIMAEQIDRGSGGRDPIGHSVGVSQMFPWFGKLDRRAEAQTEAAHAAYERLLAEQARVRAAVKQAWAEYVYLALAAGIVGEHRELLRSMEEVVRIRFRGAEAGLADLLRVQQEGDRIDVEHRDLQDMIPAARARLNAAVGRSADAPLPAPLSESVRLEPERQFDEVQLTAEIEHANPELRVMRREVASRRQAIRVARLEYYPDVMLGVQYGANAARRMARMDGGGSDTLTGMVSINLPIWREKYDAGVREAIAEFGASLKTFTDRQNTLDAELKMALYLLREARRRIELYGHVLRLRGEQVLEATLAAYRGGEASFTDLIQAQRELLEFELTHQRALADAFARAAEIEALLGHPRGAGPGNRNAREGTNR